MEPGCYLLTLRLNTYKMNITLNGETKQLAEAICLSALITELGFQGRKIAVELNQEIIPKRLYEQVMLKEGDQLEIVQAIGGG